MQRPSATEHNPRFSNYISLVPDGKYADILHNNTAASLFFFENIPADKHDYTYEVGKWSIKEVLQHIIDTERVMSYRALVALRGDSEAQMSSMDENKYAKNADVSTKTMTDLLTEFKAVRAATVCLFQHANDAESLRTANVVSHPTTARALAYIIPGHLQHHLNVIRERYL